MKVKGLIGGIVSILLATLIAISASIAQDNGNRDENRRGNRDRGGRGQFNPAEMMARELDRFQERLEFSDQEWTEVKPLFQTVLEKQFAARMGGFGGRRGPGGPGGPGMAPPPGGPGEPPSGPPPGDQNDDNRRDRPRMGPSLPEADALREVLDNKEATNEEIQAKVKALRDARKKQEDELKTAREKLREVLSVRQEASCVLMGILD